MNPTHLVNDEGNLNRYYHAMPNMYDDDLDPYEYRLIGHYKRVGLSWEGTRKVAEKTRMSVAMVSKTRKRLAEKNLLRIEMLTRKDLVDRKLVHDKNPDDKTKICVVSVVDVAKENVERYAAPCSPEKQGVHVVNGGVHHIDGGVHVVNERRSLEEEPIKKKTRAPKSGAQHDPDHPEKPIKKERPRDPMYDAIKDIWGYTAARNADLGKMLIGKATAKGSKPYNLETPISPDDLRMWAAWYRKTELHSDPALNMVGSLVKIQSSITAWQEAGKPNVTLASRPVQSATASAQANLMAVMLAEKAAS